VLLNLSNLPVIHGTTIGEILRGAALLRSSDGDIGLFGASEQVMEELRLANVGDSIRIYTDEAEALSNFCLA
jgi:anti-anti-sigma regulatory factor